MDKSRWRHFWIGISCLAVPILGIAWWIYVAQSNPGNQSDIVRQFLDPFPDFLQSAKLITWIQIAFSGAAVLAFFKGLDNNGAPKLFNLASLCVAGLIGFWLLFSLM